MIFLRFFTAIALFLLVGISANAEQLTLSVNQSQYFFEIGKEAVVPLVVENTYIDQIDGLLTYTVSQEVVQSGIHSQATNSQSVSFTVPSGTNTIPLNFGSSNVPTILKVGLSLSFFKTQQTQVNLDAFEINFVQPNQQKQSGQSKQIKSSSQTQDPPEHSSRTQELIQNNQLNQDSSALKQQFANQLNDQQKSQGSREDLLETIRQNAKFQEYDKYLSNNSFFQNNTEFSIQDNLTKVSLEYANENNQSASITVLATNNTIINVDLKLPKQSRPLILPLLIAAILAIAFFLFKVNRKKLLIVPTIEKKPFDFYSASLDLLAKANLEFNKGHYKLAYCSINQALRIYLSNTKNIKTELTNYELLALVKKNSETHKNLNTCLQSCTLVEFAKHKPSKADFTKTIQTAHTIIRK